MTNPDEEGDSQLGLVSELDRKSRLKVLHEACTTLSNDPGLHGGCTGLINLCWMDIDRSGAGMGATTRTASSVGSHGIVYVPVREDLDEGNQLILGEESVHEVVVDFLGKREGQARESFEVDMLGSEIRNVYRQLFKFLFFFVCDCPTNRVLLATERSMRVLHAYLEWWPGNDVICVLSELLVENPKGNDMVTEMHVMVYCSILLQEVAKLANQQIQESQERAAAEAQAARTASRSAKGGRPAPREFIPGMPAFGGPRGVAMRSADAQAEGPSSPTSPLGPLRLDVGSGGGGQTRRERLHLSPTRHDILHFADVVAAVDVSEWHGSCVDWTRASELLLLLVTLECNGRPVERLQRMVVDKLHNG